MANGKSLGSKIRRGKRRASRSPSPNPPSSDDAMEVPATQPSTRSRKKLRHQSSPERVMGSVLSKATKVPKKSAGLAALVALVASRGSAGPAAAKEETNNGMKNRAKRAKAKGGSRSAITDNGFRVGKIAFLREGVKTTEVDDEDDSEGDDLQPFYSTQSEVSVNANDLATLRQHRLCVVNTEGFTFSGTDTHQDLDNKFRELFPELFVWFDENPPLHFPDRSQWLVCSKRCNYKKGVMVNLDDRKLPDGADVIAACQGGPSRVSFMDLTLFLVSRQKIPTKTIQLWNFPTLKADSTDSEEDGQNYFTTGEPTAGPSNPRSLRSQSGKFLKDVDAISISSNSSLEESNPFHVLASPIEEGAVTPRYPTPPQAESIEDTFNSSLVFDRTIPNPWTTAP
ncbi:hypothetical protein GALMADRAFT_143387 [Galerina marginata CBS 339.88]|uniref:Uncharacterized protein n=1 Tax=Galerina marginata (strain CBS 339.88) TaxID=685588 RepID=A0A067SM94_GALM3|nr:hypothetical protein GALMADRAFT_143387 [Galerina marginata CBS 339.88]